MSERWGREDERGWADWGREAGEREEEKRWKYSKPKSLEWWILLLPHIHTHTHTQDFFFAYLNPHLVLVEKKLQKKRTASVEKFVPLLRVERKNTFFRKFSHGNPCDGSLPRLSLSPRDRYRDREETVKLVAPWGHVYVSKRDFFFQLLHPAASANQIKRGERRKEEKGKKW